MKSFLAHVLVHTVSSQTKSLEFGGFDSSKRLMMVIIIIVMMMIIITIAIMLMILLLLLLLIIIIIMNISSCRNARQGLDLHLTGWDSQVRGELPGDSD